MKYLISILIATAGVLYFTLVYSNKNEDIINTLIARSKINSKSDCSIFVISETGCPACNKQYFKYVLEHKANKKDNIIFSAASGMILDISPIISDTIDNVVLGKQTELDKNHLTGGSYFINIVKNKIDTIIPIKAATLSESLAYINAMK